MFKAIATDGIRLFGGLANAKFNAVGRGFIKRDPYLIADFRDLGGRKIPF